MLVAGCLTFQRREVVVVVVGSGGGGWLLIVLAKYTRGVRWLLAVLGWLTFQQHAQEARGSWWWWWWWLVA